VTEQNSSRTPGTTLTTSLSLLEMAGMGSSEAWKQIVYLYAPLVDRWCRARLVNEGAIADIGHGECHPCLGIIGNRLESLHVSVPPRRERGHGHHPGIQAAVEGSHEIQAGREHEQGALPLQAAPQQLGGNSATGAAQFRIGYSLFTAVAITEVVRHLMRTMLSPMVQYIHNGGTRWGTVRGEETIKIHRSTSSSISPY